MLRQVRQLEKDVHHLKSMCIEIVYLDADVAALMMLHCGKVRLSQSSQVVRSKYLKPGRMLKVSKISIEMKTYKAFFNFLSN